MKCKYCEKRAYFGMEDGKGTHCKQHKEDGMRYVKKVKLCEHPECKKQPTFGREGGKATHCKQHKEEGMRDVVSKICAHENCNKRPSYGDKDRKATYCKEHKRDGMQDVMNKLCEEDGCDTRPCFGKEDGKATHCGQHKKDGMRDVKNKRCEHQNCDKKPSFGNGDGIATHCKQHKEDGMRDVVHTRCEYKDCDKRSFYGTKDGEPTHCEQHKQDGMRNVVNKRCAHCNDTMVAGTKYRGYCANCFINLFPDEPLSREYKVKERHYTDIIKETFTGITATYDRRIQGGCSRRRPDFFVDLGAFTLHVEIDEFDHRDRDTTCEIAKINDTYTDLADRPMVLLRTNPDGFTDENNVWHKSCFKVHPRSGILIVADKAELKKKDQ